MKTSRKLGVPFGVAHTYIGHWTSRLARYIVRRGLLGDVRWVDSYYIQGWLATKVEDTGSQQASWRVDPKRAGGSGCGGDIGTHALMQLRYVTGLEVTDVSAQLETFVEGRQLDDHFTVYCKLGNGGTRARAGVADLHRQQERPRHHGGRDQGHPAVVAGGAGERSRSCCRASPTASTGAARCAPGDGFLPKDVPADLLAEPTIPSGHPRGVPRRVRAPAPLLRGRRPEVEGRQEVRARRLEVRERRGRLDRARVPRDLPQEQPEEGRLDGDAERDLK